MNAPREVANSAARRLPWLGLAILALVATAQAHQSRPLPPALEPFVSVNASLVALTHVGLVDGTGAPVRTDQTVILDGALLGAIGPSASTTIPSGAQVVDLTGHTLAPGMVGLHEHTYFGGAARAVQMNVSGPLLYLAHGVTTAMTAGSMLPYHELSLKRAIDGGGRRGRACSSQGRTWTETGWQRRVGAMGWAACRSMEGPRHMVGRAARQSLVRTL
jgi:imidazolonepropionase-like amidohydrolase